MGSEGRSVERTCIACRVKDEQQHFIRYVVGPDQSIHVDYRHRLPGRGAYTCIDRKCLEKAVTGGSFARAFRRSLGTIDQTVLQESITHAIRQRILGVLGIARKAGKVVSGTSTLLASFKREEVNFLLIAEDVAENSVTKLVEMADQNGAGWARFSNQEELGKIIGRENRNCAGITDKKFAEVLALEINRLQRIAGEN